MTSPGVVLRPDTSTASMRHPAASLLFAANLSHQLRRQCESDVPFTDLPSLVHERVCLGDRCSISREAVPSAIRFCSFLSRKFAGGALLLALLAVRHGLVSCRM